MRNSIFCVSGVKATPLSPLLKPTPRLGGQHWEWAFTAPDWGLKVWMWSHGKEVPSSSVRMSCPAIQDPRQYLDLGSENYNRGTEFLCICSMLCVCLQLLQCRILAVYSLSFVVSCHPPSTGVQELWVAWCSGLSLFGMGNVKGNPPASRPWHIINRRTRRGARGRGAKRLWDKLQVMSFLWSS